MENGTAGGVRYGKIPQRVPRRYKTLKRVELYHGNLVLDCPVPSKLLDKLNDRESREFTHMRYTAATCDPDNFKDERYTLRQVLFDPPRRTELFIVLTMYNEDEELFTRTMHGVMTNIAHLCTRERSKTWGKEGWKKVVVCIVSDGRLKINSRTLACLAAMGVYQEGVGKNVVNGKPVTAHIYEYTAQLSIDPSMHFKGREKGIMPVQILFCLKERNQKKINSHRWFFNAFGQILQPNICVLLDVGTMPRPRSIYHLWKAFDINSNVGGACGEIVALKASTGARSSTRSWRRRTSSTRCPTSSTSRLSRCLATSPCFPVPSRRIDTLLCRTTLWPRPAPLVLQGRDAPWWPIGRGRVYVQHVPRRGPYPVLGARVQARQRVDPALRQVGAGGDGRAGPGARTHLAASSLAQRILLCGHPLDHQVWLHLPLVALVRRKFALHIEIIYQTIQLVFSWFGMANFFIAFFILTSAMSDRIKALHVPNLVLSYIYVALSSFASCSPWAIDRRQQVRLHACHGRLCAAHALHDGAAIYLAVDSILNATGAGGGGAEALVSNRTFVNIVISLAATLVSGRLRASCSSSHGIWSRRSSSICSWRRRLST